MFFTLEARCARGEGGWWRTRKGTKRGSGGVAYTCVHRGHKMYVTEEEASERSRESVESAGRKEKNGLRMDRE